MLARKLRVRIVQDQRTALIKLLNENKWASGKKAEYEGFLFPENEEYLKKEGFKISQEEKEVKEKSHYILDFNVQVTEEELIEDLERKEE